MVISNYLTLKWSQNSSSTCDTWVEYQTADCTTTDSRIIYPTTARVRQKHIRAASTATNIYYPWDDCDNSTYCEWEVDSYSNSSVQWRSIPITPEELASQKERQFKSHFKQIIDGRCFPNIIIRQNDRRKALPMPADIREQRARETLRRVVGEKKFVGFLRSGFLSVKARSGLVYQIFPGSGMTCVFNQGQLVDKLCVVLQGGFPPTDSLIMRYLLIVNNENQFRSYAIKHTPTVQVQQYGTVDTRSLAEIFKELKEKAA